MRRSVSALFIITSGRMGSVARCLSSYVTNIQSSGLLADITLLDDSRCEKTRAELKSIIRLTAQAYSGRVSYVGYTEKEALLAMLYPKIDVPLRTLRFALFGRHRLSYNPGANRNWIPLLAPGSLVVSVDDDTTANVFVPTYVGSRVKHEDVENPLQIWLCSDSKEPASEPALKLDASALVLHERLLGRSFIQPSSPDACGTQASEEAANVAITMMGHYGDAGILDPNWLLLKGSSRSRLMASESTYHSAITSRRILRVASRWAIEKPTCFMTGAAGYDLDKLLPPFMPVLRNEDGVFSVTMMKCMPQYRMGLIPVAVEHEPPVSLRGTGSERFPTMLHYRMSDVVKWAIDGWQTTKEGASTVKLRYLGRYLETIGDMPMPEFKSWLRELRLKERDRQIATFQGMLDRHSHAPGFWAKDMSRCIIQMRRARDLGPADLVEAYGVETAVQITKTLLIELGHLYSIWEDVVNSARRDSDFSEFFSSHGRNPF